MQSIAQGHNNCVGEGVLGGNTRNQAQPQGRRRANAGKNTGFLPEYQLSRVS